jgi:hypothetical protein
MVTACTPLWAQATQQNMSIVNGFKKKKCELAIYYLYLIKLIYNYIC